MENELCAFEGNFHSMIFIGANLKEVIQPGELAKLRTLGALRGNRYWVAHAFEDLFAVQYMQRRWTKWLHPYAKETNVNDWVVER